jgi:hypothetical protein
MTDLKAALDEALRRAAAQRRRYRVADPHERLVLEAAAAFRAMLEDPRLAPQLAALLREIQGRGADQGEAPPTIAPPA